MVFMPSEFAAITIAESGILCAITTKQSGWSAFNKPKIFFAVGDPMSFTLLFCGKVLRAIFSLPNSVLSQ